MPTTYPVAAAQVLPGDTIVSTHEALGCTFYDVVTTTVRNMNAVTIEARRYLAAKGPGQTPSAHMRTVSAVAVQEVAARYSDVPGPFGTWPNP